MTKSIKKPAIILIHGLRGTHDGLSALSTNLKAEGFQVFTPDLPGSGSSPALSPSAQNLQGYAAWLNTYLKSLHLSTKPYLIGHSMGSIIVSHFLKHYSHTVQSRVILLSPIFRTRRGQNTSNRLFALTRSALRLLPEPQRYAFLKSHFVSFCISHYLTVNKNLQREIDTLHYRYSGQFASAASLLSDMQISMQSQTILLPSNQYLLILGDHDRLTSLKTAKATISTHQAAVLKVLHGTGHLLNYEQPRQATMLIRDFYFKPPRHPRRAANT